MTAKRKQTSGGKKGSKRPGKVTLSVKDLEHFKQMLSEKRKEIVGNVTEIKDEALKQSRMDAAGDLSSMPIHMADIGSDNFEQELALGLMDSERKLLNEIDSALQRIDEGTYGICEGTGQSISKARLEAQPWARYCVEYAQLLEQSATTEPLTTVSERGQGGEEEEADSQEAPDDSP